jgi:imidazolonepropionase-like amidohydrolase
VLQAEKRHGSNFLEKIRDYRVCAPGNRSDAAVGRLADARPSREVAVKLIVRIVALSVVLCWMVFPANAQEDVTAIRATRLIDGSGAPPIRDAVIVVRGDSIIAVGTAAEISIPAGAEVVDLGDFTILPGLMDCHDHITGTPGDGGDTQALRESEAHAAIHGVVNARITLDSGFTTIRNVGSSTYADVAVKEMINSGKIVGPRMYVATRGLGITGGHADINGWSHSLDLPGYAEIADGVDEVRKAVRRQVKFGADLIKVTATGGVLSAGDAVGAQQYSYEELVAIVEEADRAGIKVAAHAHGASGIVQASNAGVASIEHGSLIDEEGIAAMKANGTFVVPTLYALDFIIEEGAEAGVPQYGIDKAISIAADQRRLLRRAYQQGVRFAYGTDAAVFPHGRNARDFGILVEELGVPPLEAIKMATADAAELIGIDAQVGTLVAGKWADIIAVDGNPLDDIRVIEDGVRFVMKGGIVYKHDR